MGISTKLIYHRTNRNITAITCEGTQAELVELIPLGPFDVSTLLP
tara:strand:- start:818 stop:952 length:135 start_codon:yes stop_codon:yes gene_type:complete